VKHAENTPETETGREIEHCEAKIAHPALAQEALPILRIEKPLAPEYETEPPREEERDEGDALAVPVVYRKENMQKERTFVSKGHIITHYEDDIDVPTFLRKQMQ
jgi:hypothetical protein